MSQGNWRTEHGEEYAVPAEIYADPRFKDISWHNDMCPLFAVRNAGGTVSLWVDHPDEALRESMGDRFTVVRNTCDESGEEWLDHWEGEEPTKVTVYEGNNVMEAIAAALKTADEERIKYPALNKPITRHIFKNGDIEVGTGEPGYRWTQGYSEVTPSGGVTNPVTLADQRAMAKRDGVTLKLHDSEAAARAAANG